MARLLVILLITGGLLAGVLLWSAGTSEPPADFTFINRGDHKTLDPGTMSWLQDIRVAYALWEGLYTLDPATLAPIPGQADRLDIDPTRTIYTFHLRSGIRWSNGDTVTAGDFVFAWRRALENPAEYSSLLFYISGAEKYSDDYAAWVDQADKQPGLTGLPPPDFRTVGINALDGQTLAVRLRNPTPFFLSLCAFPAFFPQHEPSMRAYARLDDHTGRIQSYDQTFTRPPHLISNGPYRLSEWTFKRKLRMVASDTYWNKSTVHCHIIDEPVDAGPLPDFRAFISGQVDWLTWVEEDLIGQMRQAGGYPDLHTFQGFGTEFYVFYCPPRFLDGAPNPLSDVRVRRALVMALDKRAVVEDVVKAGQPIAYDYIPPGAFKNYPSPPGIHFDPIEARRLLAAAGYPGGRGFPHLQLIFNNEKLEHSDIALIFHSQWLANLGIDVDTQGLEVKIHGYRLHAHDFAIARASWIGDYPDPTTFTDKFKSDNDNNDGLWSNKQYDALCTAAETQSDPAQRMKTLAQAENILLEDAALIPIYHYVDAYMFGSNIKGIPFDPRDMVMFQAIQKVR